MDINQAVLPEKYRKNPRYKCGFNSLSIGNIIFFREDIMKTAVVYRSVSGFTEKYAEWISDGLKGDLYRLSGCSGNILMKYDAVIYGGPLHAAGISGLKSFKKMLKSQDDLKVAVFACGASAPDDKVLEDVKKRNFSEDELKRISFHYFRGGFDFDKLNFINKLIMSLMKKMLERKKERTEEEQGMLDSYDNPADFTDRENIKALIEEFLI